MNMDNVSKYFEDFLIKCSTIEEAIINWNSDSVKKEFNVLINTSTNKVSSIKDINKPKGVRSSYMFYCNTSNRDRIKKDNPTANAKEIISLLAKEWNELNEEVKQQYVKLYDEDKKRHVEEMTEYNSNSTKDTVVKVKSKTKNKEVKSKSTSAWQFFCINTRKEASNTIANGRDKVPSSEVMKYMGTLWKELDEDGKKPYNDKALENKK